MPTREDLTGLGMAPELSNLLGNSPKLVTCAGTSQGTATAILTHNVELNAQSSQTGAILPSSAKIGTPYFLANGTTSATSGVVYVPVGHTLNGTLNNGLTLAANKAAIIWQYRTNFWASVLTA